MSIKAAAAISGEAIKLTAKKRPNDCPRARAKRPIARAQPIHTATATSIHTIRPALGVTMNESDDEVSATSSGNIIARSYPRAE